MEGGGESVAVSVCVIGGFPTLTCVTAVDLTAGPRASHVHQ